MLFTFFFALQNKICLIGSCSIFLLIILFVIVFLIVRQLSPDDSWSAYYKLGPSKSLLHSYLLFLLPSTLYMWVLLFVISLYFWDTSAEVEKSLSDALQTFPWFFAPVFPFFQFFFFLTASKRLALAVLVVALLHLVVTLWFCLIIMTQYLATYCRLSQQYCWLRLSNASLSQYCQHDSVMPPRLSNAGNNISATPKASFSVLLCC